MSQLKVFEPKVALLQVKMGDILAAKTDCWFDHVRLVTGATLRITRRKADQLVRFLQVLESLCVLFDYFCGRGCRVEISVYSRLLN